MTAGVYFFAFFQGAFGLPFFVMGRCFRWERQGYRVLRWRSAATPERGGRANGGGARGGGDRAAHLPAFHAGADALRHRKIPYRQKYPHAHGEGDVAAQDGGEHPL